MTREQALEIILDPRGGPAEGTPKHRELMTFLEGSPECREIYLQQRQVWESLDLWEEVEPSAGFDRRLMAEVERGGADLPWFAQWTRHWRPSFALGLAALVLIAAAITGRQPGLVPEPREIAEDAAYVEEIHETLDDLEMLADFDALPLGG